MFAEHKNRNLHWTIICFWCCRLWSSSWRKTCENAASPMLWPRLRLVPVSVSLPLCTFVILSNVKLNSTTNKVHFFSSNKVHHWFFPCRHSMVYWSFYYDMCSGTWPQRETRIRSMHNRCKFLSTNTMQPHCLFHLWDLRLSCMELTKQTVWYSSLLLFLKWKHNKCTKYSWVLGKGLYLYILNINRSEKNAEY